jgi:hypothetical protein
MIKSPNDRPWSRRIVAQPLYQAVIIFVFGLFLTLIDSGTGSSNVASSKFSTAWILLTACILFYALCSSVLSLWAMNPNKYWRDAIFSFVGLMVVSGFTATLVSGQGIDEAGSFRWLFVVLSIGYLVFLTIVRLMRRIVDIAIRQDERLRGGE